MAGVNVTLGLPIIRTSVDHGTAFGKAGEGRANPQSLIEAIRLAVDLPAGDHKIFISYPLSWLHDDLDHALDPFVTVVVFGHSRRGKPWRSGSGCPFEPREPE